MHEDNDGRKRWFVGEKDANHFRQLTLHASKPRETLIEKWRQHVTLQLHALCDRHLLPEE